MSEICVEPKQCDGHYELPCSGPKLSRHSERGMGELLTHGMGFIARLRPINNAFVLKRSDDAGSGVQSLRDSGLDSPSGSLITRERSKKESKHRYHCYFQGLRAFLIGWF